MILLYQCINYLYSVGKKLSIKWCNISKLKKGVQYIFGHSKLSCGCGWTVNYRAGDFHPLFLTCVGTL